MTTEPATSLADSVKDATKSPSTTTDSTLSLLRALLGITETQTTSTAAKLKSRTPTSSSRSNVKPVRAGKITQSSGARGPAKVIVYEAAETCNPLSSTAQRLNLATEVFNTSLKTLTTAVRSQKLTKAQSNHASPPKSPQAAGKRPLGNCSPNRQTKTSSDRKQKAGVVFPPSPLEADFSKTAECARTALACLRQLRNGKKNEANTEDSQLDQAALILIEKLQSLGLTELAIEEIHTLRVELDRSIRGENGALVHQDENDIIKRETSGSLAHALRSVALPNSRKLFNLLVSFHKQVLRACEVLGRRGVDQNLVDILHVSNELGPVAMILRSFEKQLITQEEAFLQLQNLSQAVLSVCSQSRITSAQSMKQKVSAETDFDLHLLAIELQRLCRDLSSSTFDLERHVWTPFNKIASRYFRDSESSSSEKYKRVKDAFLRLKDPRLVGFSIRSRDEVAVPHSVFEAVARLAEDCGQITESLQLLNESLNQIDPEKPLLSVVCRCNIATLLLQSAIENPQEAVDGTKIAVEALGNSIKGSAADIESMMLQAVRLRKAALMTFITLEKLMQKAPLRELHSKVWMCSIKTIFAFAKVLIRYLGHPVSSSDATSPSLLEKYHQRVHVWRAVGETTMSNLIGTAKSAIENTRVPWQEVRSALKDCSELAQIFENVTGEADARHDDSQKKISYFVRVSNLYWTKFLKCEEHGDDHVESVALLRGSIEVLKNRPEVEQIQGFLAAKHEKIASILIEMRNFVAARDALRSSIALHTSTNAFHVAVSKQSWNSIGSFWNDDSSDMFAMGKVLAAYARILPRTEGTISESGQHYDDPTLATEERAALLEKQLSSLIDTPSSSLSDSLIISCVRSILVLYSTTPYAMHRLRFLLEIFQCTSKQIDCLSSKSFEEYLNDEIFQELEQSIMALPSLTVYGIPLFAMLKLQYSFQSGRPSVSLLRRFIDVWSDYFAEYHSQQAISDIVNDPGIIINQLKCIIDFSDMLDLMDMKLRALLLLRRVIELQINKDPIALAACLTQIGLHLSRLGNSIDSGCALALAEKLVSSSKSQSITYLQCQLARAEYLLSIHNLEQGLEALQLARVRYQIDFPLEKEGETRRGRLVQDNFLCQAAFVTSRIEYERGNLHAAILNARQTVKVSSKIWTALEGMATGNQPQNGEERKEITIETVTNGIRDISIQANSTNALTALKGSNFWPHVNIHFLALLHVSSLSAHCGLFQDAIYYAEQALQIGRAIDSKLCLLKAESLLSAHLIRGGETTRGVEYYKSALARIAEEENKLAAVPSALLLAEASRDLQTTMDTSEAIQLTEKLLSSVRSNATLNSTFDFGFRTKVEGRTPLPIVEKPTGRKAAKGPVISKKIVKRAPATKLSDRKAMNVAETDSEIPVNLSITPSLALTRLQISLDILKAQVLLKSSNIQDALSLINTLDINPSSNTLTIQKCLLQARGLVIQAMEMYRTTTVHFVLAETTIAYPSVQRNSGISGRQIAEQKPLIQKKVAESRRKVQKVRPSSFDKAEQNEDQPQELVGRALDLLLSATKSPSYSCSTKTLREISRVLNQCFMISTAVSQQRNYQSVQMASSLTFPNSSTIAREGAMILADTILADKANALSWPKVSNKDIEINASSFEYTFALQHEILDILPESWGIFSIGLNTDLDELSISRLNFGQSPFLLRIPLRRSNSENPEAEDFDFIAAKNELMEIIERANQTAHDSRSQSEKQARKAWWNERESLDGRLKDLVENIENIWLGGFRAVFSQTLPDEELLSRFANTLYRSLDQHLPSRQVKGRKSQIVLHPYVLGLFVGLGHPDKQDLDEPLTDLLYFVVDVLQFQGEHNAYDEIDFDIILADLLDALRCYHEALTVDVSNKEHHTILILDKELLAFPWESLPCLADRPVSRLPSLSCLKLRLDRMRSQDSDASALRICSSNGTYILNPSSDLSSTQSTFGHALSISLPDASSIVNRAPTEVEFEACLREHDFFLYFGHGSGAQYIRARSIKRLDKCAVAFLMGCSSGKMTECGHFEPHGVPWNYMHAGAPAVVGTLWDVTDKDIDRFAMKTLGNWGLFGEDVVAQVQPEADSTVRTKMGAKLKGKGKKQTPEVVPAEQHGQNKDQVALDAAVAKARNSCLLRYLNGAAPVVYGIPVVLG